MKMTGRRMPRNERTNFLAGDVFAGRRQLKSAALNASRSVMGDINVRDSNSNAHGCVVNMDFVC